MSENEFGTVLHPTSGEVYAVEITKDDRIVRAFGPLSRRALDPTSPEWIGDDGAGAQWLVENANQENTLDDGAWLDAEFGLRAITRSKP